MHKAPLFLLVLIFTFGLVACQPSPTEAPAPVATPSAPKPAPVASFSARSFFTTDGRHVVEFSNTSVNAISYLWRFGDGASSSVESPVHEYRESGSYEVRLTATAADGRESTVERSIAVQ